MIQTAGPGEDLMGMRYVAETTVFGEVLNTRMRTPHGMLSFTCDDLETAVGVLSAAEDIGGYR